MRVEGRGVRTDNEVNKHKGVLLVFLFHTKEFKDFYKQMESQKQMERHVSEASKHKQLKKQNCRKRYYLHNYYSIIIYYVCVRSRSI